MAGALAATGIGTVALKPAEHDLRRAFDLPDGTGVVFDWEGEKHLPDAGFLAELAAERPVRVTAPVRCDGFDPLGDDSIDAGLPDAVGRVLVAGHGAYLDEGERRRRVAPRLAAAAEAHPEPWVGTQGIERLALATGATQFELLERTTERDVEDLRTAGFAGELALYAPAVLTDDEDEILDALGEYVARRGPVERALPGGAPTDADATGRAREVLLAAADDYALVGNTAAVAERVETFRTAGVDRVVAYPARGLGDVL
jgi:hypothetical protein